MEKIRLRYWRNLKAITIRELAKKAGVTTRTIVEIESHGHIPTLPIIRKLATALEIEPKDLYGEGLDLSTMGKGHRQKAINGLAVFSTTVSGDALAVAS